MRFLRPWTRHLATTAWCGGLLIMAALLLSCATQAKPSLQERLTAMGDTELIAYYQGIDARLRAVGEGVRREAADTEGVRHPPSLQQPYFLGGEGQRLLHQRTAAEKELRRREIPPIRWATSPDP